MEQLMRNPAISLVLGAILLSPGLAAVNVKKKDAPVARTVVDHYKEAEPSRVSVGIDAPRLSASAILLTDVKTERRQSPQGKGSLSLFQVYLQLSTWVFINLPLGQKERKVLSSLARFFWQGSHLAQQRTGWDIRAIR
jgi:hypothetical protein